MLKTIIIFIFILSVPISACAQQQKETSYFQNIESKYLIPIEYSEVEKSFPDYWFNEPIKAHVEPLTLNEENIQIINQALNSIFSAYPQKVLSESLRSIGLVNKLYFYDSFYGATYTQTFMKNSVYLSTQSTDLNADITKYLIDSFHHEFSSILMKKFEFPEQRWRDANPPNFIYEYEKNQNPGLEAMNNKVQTGDVEELHAQGFFSEYSMSSIEEDLNVFSGVAFTYPDWMISLAEKYPLMKKKLSVWISFYRSIDPDFDKTPVFLKFKEKKLY